jgi:hypothetical protein
MMGLLGCKSPLYEESSSNDASIEVIPPKTSYLMGEDLGTEFQVFNILEDGTKELTTRYIITGDTFTSGKREITIALNDDESKTATFDITVSDLLVDTGLPVIYIDTKGREIADKENYVNMNFRLTNTDNSEYDFEITDYSARIRGRGNQTWTLPKKPYRLNFAQATSFFGLTANKNWVLLANYRDPTLIANTVAFKLGELFKFPWTNHTFHVEVVLNGEYQGSYVLTEHSRVGAGRVDIDPNGSFLVEIDAYYDEEPKFMTPRLQLPVMILYPEGSADANDPMFDFVRDAINQMDALLSAPSFPNNGWKDVVDVNSAVDYLMINEIAQNTQIGYPRSVYMYMEAGGKLKMGHLWDFDGGFGLWDNQGKDYSYIHIGGETGRFTGGQHWGRFYKDVVFIERYKARWNEKYSDILTIPAFIDTMYNQLKKSAELDNQRWPGRAIFYSEIAKLKTWYSGRISYLDGEINKEP